MFLFDGRSYSRQQQQQQQQQQRRSSSSSSSSDSYRQTEVQESTEYSACSAYVLCALARGART